MISRPYFKFLRPLFSSKLNWQKLAWEAQERVITSERKLRESEQLRYEDRITSLQSDLLRLRNNFNLRGALEYSLEAYGDIIKVPKENKAVLLDHLTNDPDYKKHLQSICQTLEVREYDANMCAHVLYHKLSKHAHGNTAELIINDKEHAMTNVAAMEAVFGTLKTKGCFQIPMKVIIQNHERTL